MYRDLIKAPEQIRVNGIDWWIQVFNHWDGTFDAVNLYDPDGWFVCEFPSMEELKDFLEGVIPQ